MNRDRVDSCVIGVSTLALLLALPCVLVAEAGGVLNDDGSVRQAGEARPSVPRPAAPEGTGSLTTLFTGGNSFAGNTFDIVPTVDMTILSFDVNLGTGTPTTMEIYWRNGTAQGFESSAAGWTSMGTAVVNPAGINIPTPVPIGGLSLTAGNTYGFYVDVVSYPSASIQYTNGGPTPFSNADLTLTTFHGKGNPAFTGASFFPRQWNGTVYYDFDVQVDSDLALTKVASDPIVAAGDPLTYTLTVTNNGPDSADNVVVTDNLPAEFSWTSDDCAAGPPAGGPPNGTLTWNVGTLANGASAVCNVTGTIDGAEGAVVVNNASATSDSTDPTPPTAAVTVTIAVATSVLEIPSLSFVGLVALALVLAAGALLALRRARRA